MTALVTGGTGFIGISLIEQLLARGYHVRCVAKDTLNLEDLRRLSVEIVLGDLVNGISWQSILKRVDVVFHVAGVTKARTKEDFFLGNYLAISSLLDSCKRFATRLQRFLHVSSLAVVGLSPDGRPLTEEAPYHPLTTYGHTKMMGEQEVLRNANELPVTVIRPSSVYGPRERDILQMFRIVKRGLLPVVGFRDKFLSLIHVKDLVRGIIAAAESPVTKGQVYFLGSEEVYSSLQVGKAIAKASHRRPLTVRLPHFAAYVTGWLCQLIGKCSNKVAVCNLEKVRDMTQGAWVCDVSKSRYHFGYRQRISLEDGIKETFESYLANGWLS
jgi:nucleoside-diphosphate-sugar epimerase